LLESLEEEIKDAERKFHLKLIRDRKERVLIATEIAKLSFEEGLVELAYEGATLAVNRNWDP